FGLKLDADWWIDLGFGLLLGAVLMAGIFLIELAAGWVTVTGTFVAAEGNAIVGIVAVLIAFLCVGFYEEVLSRGYHLVNLAEGFSGLGKAPAIALATLLSSALFGVLHATNPNASALSTFNIFLAGFMLAAGMLLTGKLAIPIGLHITWNFFQGAVFGFPVSGLSPVATVVAVEQGGPALLTGGAFGPEAGLIGVAAMAVGIALTVGYVRLRYGSVDLHGPLVEPALRVRAEQP
ncbi:MAG: lysostaphin resistance A-like protein, partial [Anaerolineae bacterium]